MMLIRKLRMIIMASLIMAPAVYGEGFSSLGDEIWSAFPRQTSEKQVPFGTSVALSADGKRVLVGDPFFDYRFATANGMQIGNISRQGRQGGGVFLYQLEEEEEEDGPNNGTWKQVWYLFGNEAERIGRYIAISPTGQYIAVRRGDGSVHVYHWSSSRQLVGDAITDCPGGAIELSSEPYVTVSCDNYDSDRGKVQVYELKDNSIWEPLVSIEGENQDDRFGWRTALDSSTATGPVLFRLAVSAPYYQDKTGLVRVYNVFKGARNERYKQIGDDLVGDSPGELFGFDLAMSETADRILAIGAPLSGAVRLYSYQRPSQSWRRLNEIAGPADGDSLGRNVVLTPDAGRLAVASYQHQGFTGLVRIYERIDQESYELEASVTGDSALERWGSDIALSETGSVLASGSTFKRNQEGQSRGSVRVLLDKTPFCSLPLEDDEDPYLSRRLCRNGQTLVTAAEDCTARVETQGGQLRRCVWIAPPTPAPTIISSTQKPSMSPTMIMMFDMVDQSSPTPKPSTTKTTEPTPAPTNEPTAVPAPPGLFACLCDMDGRCANHPLSKGQDLFLCIVGRLSNMELLGVSRFSLEQGIGRSVVIDERGAHISGVTASCGNNTCEIVTPVDPAFFLGDQPGDLIASGTIVVAFPGRLLLRGGGRRLMEGVFSVDVSLDPARTDIENKPSALKIALVVVLSAILFFGFLWLVCVYCPTWFCNKDIDDEEEEEEDGKKHKASKTYS